jgi:hypothetical protein
VGIELARQVDTELSLASAQGTYPEKGDRDYM